MLRAEFTASLDTARHAQQILVEQGLVRVDHGVGAFVVGTEIVEAIDIDEQLRIARHAIELAIAERRRLRQGASAGALEA